MSSSCSAGRASAAVDGNDLPGDLLGGRAGAPVCRDRADADHRAARRAALSQLLRVLLDDVRRNVGRYRTPRSDPGSYDGPPLHAAGVFGNQ